ncbi:MAG: hypothetical protein ACKOUT_12145 [Novosphingobium sp.]
MAYDPRAITEKVRARGFKMMWLGAACMVAVLLWTIFLPDREPIGPIFGFAIGGPLGAAIAWKSDDYYKSLCNMGLRFSGAFLVVYTFAAWIFRFILDPNPLTAVVLDGYYLGLAAIALFYVGYTYAWFRDRSWSDGAP